MQNFLRQQSESIHSINMVAEITSLLHMITKKRHITSDTLPLLIQIFKTLIELSSGNYKNHKVIFNSQIISTINYILQMDISKIRGQSRFHRASNTTVISNQYDLESIGRRSCQRKSNIDYVDLRKNALELKSYAVELLVIMLEEVSIHTKSLTVQIAGGLDIHALHWSMVDFYILKNDKDLIRIMFDDNASRSLFKTYTIFQQLIDREAAPAEKLSKS